MSDEPKKGPLAWMAANSVAANLLMGVLILGGLLMIPRIKQEIFPEFELSIVVVSVAYPGASPAEVEQGVVLAIEEAVREIEGVKNVFSSASEGGAVVTVELNDSADPDRGLADVKSAVDRITSFPEDIERPVVSLAINRVEVISLVFYGDQEERTLRSLAERAREDLLKRDDISLVSLFGVRPLEVSIEVPEAQLRRYGLTLDQIADVVRRTSVETPAGGVRTKSGEILVRTAERRLTKQQFEDIIVLSRADGTEVRISDLGVVKDGFQEIDQSAYYNGKRAVMVKAYRVGDQTPITISDAVNEYHREIQGRMPDGVKTAIWGDFSEFYRDRIDLLLRNAYMGLALVFLVLGLFLEIRLAFWVTVGIPTSFFGALLFLPAADASINMISLFAFIVTLGLVVDDAIVAGEAIYKRRTDGESPLAAAVHGVREVAAPISFAILTTIIAFSPMLFVPGPAGKFFRLIPIVVIAVLLISWVESVLILPAHLAHIKDPTGRGVYGFLHRYQQRFSRGVEWFIERAYTPILRASANRRYLTLACSISLLFVTVGLIAGQRVKFTFLPDTEGDIIVADLRLPFGVDVSDTAEVTERIVAAGKKALEESGGETKLSRGIFAQVGNNGALKGGDQAPGGLSPGSHKAEVAIFLVPIDQRNFGAADFVRRWRKHLGELPGIEALKFQYSTTPSEGSPVQIELNHSNMAVLEAASADLAHRYRSYDGLYQIDSGFSPGKQQLDFRLKPAARAQGMTAADLARQTRAAFFGAEAVRQQRGRDEVRVYVRLPEHERQSEYDVERLIVRTPRGGEMPLLDAAEVTRGRSYTRIRRRRSRRYVDVTAEVDSNVANATEVVQDLKKNVLPELLSRYPGLGYSLEGEQKQQAEVLTSLGNGFVMSGLAIFALLAVAFRSYIQPAIIMAVIPFGLVGAVIGHVLMGYDLSLMSLMGIVALSGVVVNDSLILIVAINRHRENGVSAEEAVVLGGARRFRPIILTSLTTFFGLVPMILENSVQARFLIPMAVSLGFGVLFATGITLVLVPAIYRIVVDAKQLATRARRFLMGDELQSASAGE